MYLQLRSWVKEAVFPYHLLRFPIYETSSFHRSSKDDLSEISAIFQLTADPHSLFPIPRQAVGYDVTVFHIRGRIRKSGFDGITAIIYNESFLW